jgi:hypothetical protein
MFRSFFHQITISLAVRMHAFLPIPWPACDDLRVARFMPTWSDKEYLRDNNRKS